MSAIAHDSLWKIEGSQIYKRILRNVEEKIDRLLEIEKQSWTESIAVSWLETITNNQQLDTQAREYQREKVGDEAWKQNLMISIIEKVTEVDITILNMIHIRVKIVNGIVTFELIDGQQRVTTILDFIKNGFALPDNFQVNDLDLSGMTFADLVKKGGEYKEIADGIKNFEITTSFYTNLTDQETSDYFVYKLNNVLDMNDQEKRNAILGGLSRWIRNTARFEGTMHELFTVVKESGNIAKMKYFKIAGKTINTKILQRMERDEWLAKLVFMALNGWEKGVNSTMLNKFYKETQSESGIYKLDFTKKKVIKKLLDVGLEICKIADSLDYKSRMNAMNLLMMIFYSREIEKTSGKINLDLFVESWFKMATEWSDTSKKLYEGRFEHNGITPLKPFWDNFNGINSNAIRTIKMIADENLPDVGIDIDTRNFTKKQILQKLEEQGFKDAVTGRKLSIDDAVGDHIIPRSEGKINGGVTEMHNLQVISRYNNSTKSNMNDKSFRKQMKKAS